MPLLPCIYLVLSIQSEEQQLKFWYIHILSGDFPPGVLYDIIFKHRCVEPRKCLISLSCFKTCVRICLHKQNRTWIFGLFYFILVCELWIWLYNATGRQCELYWRVWWNCLGSKGKKGLPMTMKESYWLQYLGKERNKEAGACPGKCMLKESFATMHLSSLSHETLWYHIQTQFNFELPQNYLFIFVLKDNILKLVLLFCQFGYCNLLPS